MARVDVALFTRADVARGPSAWTRLAELEKVLHARGADARALAEESRARDRAHEASARAKALTLERLCRSWSEARECAVRLGEEDARGRGGARDAGARAEARAEAAVAAAAEARTRADAAKKEYDAARARQEREMRTVRDESRCAEAEARCAEARASFERARGELMLALQRAELWERTRDKRQMVELLEAELDHFRRGVEILTQFEPSMELARRELEELERANADAEAALKEELAKLTSSADDAPQTTSEALTMSSERSREMSAQMASSAAGYGSSRTAQGENEALMQGYLLKRSSGTIQDWKRRYFVLDARGNLTYVKSTQTTGKKTLGRLLSSRGGNSAGGGETKETVSLLTATIKPDLDDGSSQMRYAFRIVSPERTFYLRAENSAEQIQWIEAITTAIANLLNSSVNEKVMAEHEERTRKYGDRHSRTLSSVSNMSAPDGPTPIAVLSAVPGNDTCADCGMPEPDWASLNLGIMICLQCSGVHRQLGVSVSKVRSATLDVRAWDTSTLDFFKRWGNTESNARWEADPEHAKKKPERNASLETRKAYILEKYVGRAFCKRGAPPTESQLLTAINHKNLPGVMDILLKGLPVKMGYVMITAACDAGEAALAILEALIHHGVDPNAVECAYSEDRPLHYAVRHARDAFAKTLIRRGADPTARNGRGKTPFDVAVDVHGAIRDDELLILLSGD